MNLLFMQSWGGLGRRPFTFGRSKAKLLSSLSPSPFPTSINQPLNLLFLPSSFFPLFRRPIVRFRKVPVVPASEELS